MLADFSLFCLRRQCYSGFFCSWRWATNLRRDSLA